MIGRETGPPLSARDHALLVRLADGTLSPRARERAHRRLQGIPYAGQLIDRQRRVARALGAGEEHAAPVPSWGGRTFLPTLATAGALALVLLALLVVVPQGGRSPVWDAAALAHEPATQAAPAEDGTLLRAGVEGVRFPDWSRAFGWNETGLRRDEIAGRPATTVFYEHMTHRLAYTIVAGKALPRPDGARRVVRRDGLDIALYRDGDHDVAVFERDGRTCVLAGHVIHESTILDLAAWAGGGRVRG